MIPSRKNDGVIMTRVNKPTKDPHCKKCGALKEGAYAIESMCGSCLSEYRKQKRLDKRLATGGSPRSEYGSGRSPLCSKCGKEKDDAFKSSGYCRECTAERNKLARVKKRRELDMLPYKSGPNPICRCGKPKERPKARECNECHRIRDSEWRLKTGRTLRHRTGLCRCGQPMAKYSKCYCKDCLAKIARERLRNDEQFREKIYERNRKRRLRSPEEFIKYSARTLIRNMLNKGYIFKEPCSVCGSTENIEAHHEDYSRPFDVTWLCRQHHNDAHHPTKQDSIDDEIPEDPIKKHKHYARLEVGRAIKKGILLRNPCEICGVVKVEAHHDDYAKPLEVTWLCRKHHVAHHRKIELKEEI